MLHGFRGLRFGLEMNEGDARFVVDQLELLEALEPIATITLQNLIGPNIPERVHI